MNRSFKLTSLILTLALVIWFQTGYQRAEGESLAPGNSNDPIITKSYLDQELAKVKATNTSTNATTNSPITIVQLQTGQTLYAAAGAEVIVRTGKTVAVSSDTNGIPDVTDGSDIAPGAAVQTNHMLVFPREGRGIKPDPKNTADIFIMVRGEYTLYNADGSKVTP
ncbi:hypothetical protein [Gorillibacterium sp. sgz5001074]|uniref:hypothetical protein n=1 Tax=Gorillibacterium sp. sgz5001074 TaxID=3446695 RepID=UPI003F6801AA